MTAKEYLSQAFLLNVRISSKVAQAQSLRDTATKASAVLSGMPHSPSRNIYRMEEAIVRMVDLENEIAEHVECLVSLKRDIARAINSVESETHRILLELRYLCFKDWEQIAEDMHYERRYVLKLHGQALKRVDTKSA